MVADPPFVRSAGGARPALTGVGGIGAGCREIWPNGKERLRHPRPYRSPRNWRRAPRAEFEKGAAPSEWRDSSTSTAGAGRGGAGLGEGLGNGCRGLGKRLGLGLGRGWSLAEGKGQSPEELGSLKR